MPKMTKEEIVDDKIRHDIQESAYEQDKKQILKIYSDRYLELQLFKSQHAQIFAELADKENILAEVEKILKEVARLTGDLENETVKVSVSERWRKYYDYVVFSTRATEAEKKKLEDNNGIITEINKEVFDSLVADGEISPETKQFSFREELLNKAVSIKIKQQ